ncbi:hypothetical protein [Streptomyces sp. F001]|uniref:hypothetical protein n=1 Tax=Streptomyces sp. F001 TaxID=1510026 RepID=UPI0032097AA5
MEAEFAGLRGRAQQCVALTEHVRRGGHGRCDGQLGREQPDGVAQPGETVPDVRHVVLRLEPHTPGPLVAVGRPGRRVSR